MVQHMDTPAFQQYWVLDAQWTDCPLEVEADVKKIWSFKELGNDKYMWRGSIRDLEDMAELGSDPDYSYQEYVEGEGWKHVPLNLDSLIAYVKAQGRADDEDFIIHWWW